MAVVFVASDLVEVATWIGSNRRTRSNFPSSPWILSAADEVSAGTAQEGRLLELRIDSMRPSVAKMVGIVRPL